MINPRTKKNSVNLPCRKIGKGDQIALAFHGFGQDSTYYASFESVLGGEYTIFSFDLPFHGTDESEKNGLPADRNDLRVFFKSFMAIHDIRDFTIIGFSIGAKISLLLMKFFPEQTKRLLLIAPDGFGKNFWFRLATGSRLTRSIFHYVMHHPELFFNFSDLMVRLKLVHPGLSRFARSQMNTLPKREKVFYTWMYFRNLSITKKDLLKIISKYNIPVCVFLGTEDKIIRPVQFEFLKKHPGVDLLITLLPAGHHRLIEATAEYLEKNPEDCPL